MKFYLAVDVDGKKQLRTTKIDIEKVNKTYEQIDIAVDQAGIQHLVQESFDEIFRLQGEINSLKHDASINHPPAPAAPATVPVIAPLDRSQQRSSSLTERSLEAAEIEVFILNRAEIFHCENIFACLGTRFGELANKVQSTES